MRRTLRFLEWRTEQWREWAVTRADVDDAALAEGLHAYALRQAGVFERIGMSFREMWETPAPRAARKAVQLDIDLSSLFINDVACI